MQNVTEAGVHNFYRKYKYIHNMIDSVFISFFEKIVIKGMCLMVGDRYSYSRKDRS